MREATNHRSHVGKLSSMGAITVTYPNFTCPRSHGLKCDLLAIGGKLRIKCLYAGTDPRPWIANPARPPFGGDKSTPQTLILEISRVYTSRPPRRARSRAELLSTDSGTGSLFRAPERLIRHTL